MTKRKRSSNSKSGGGGRIRQFFASVRDRLPFLGGEESDREEGWVVTMFGHLRSNFTLISVVVLAVTASVLLSKVRSYATGLEGYIVHPEVFRLESDSPPWFTRADVEQLRTTLGEVGPFSVFREGVRGRLGAALEGNPWIRDVTSVRRDLPNAVEVRLHIRKPIAWVEYNASYHLVDRHCVRLPGRYPSPYTFPFPMPIIRGDVGQFSEYPEEGKLWADDAVQQGVAVALELYDLYNSDMFDVVRIDEIDVANVRGRIDERDSQIVLAARGGVRIDWGRSLLSTEFGEVDTAHKLANLRQVLSEYPRLIGLREVSLQWDDPTVKIELNRSAGGGSG